MAKIDKSQYTKEEWHKIRARRRAEKQQEKLQESASTQEYSITNHFSNTTDTAFVIGNGTSRKDINLEKLKEFGKIYGCNALYRDFDPDFLIAVDAKMILEINQAKYQHKTSVWTNPNRQYSTMTGFNFFNPSKGWSSGPTALWLASEHKYKKIFILGFDYKGIGKDHGIVNNIFSGTKNYKKNNEKATYFGNWLKQTVSTIQKHSHIDYYRVLNTDGFVPKEFTKLNNLHHVYVEDFIKKFN